MPNGGIDNCCTCWFNAKNKGDHGHSHANDPGPSYCSIRELPIDEGPAYTYCNNHPYVRRGRDRIPIGPVYKHDHRVDRRELWTPSPDTEEIRRHLRCVLAESYGPEDLAQESIAALWDHMDEDLPHAFMCDEHGEVIHQVQETAVWQLGEFREVRALDVLRRIVEFYDQAVGPLVTSHARILTEAREAIAKIAESPTRQDPVTP